MTPLQLANMQAAVEKTVYEIERLSIEIEKIKARADQEDLRKRLYRVFSILGIMALMATQWWGFYTVIELMNIGNACTH